MTNSIVKTKVVPTSVVLISILVAFYADIKPINYLFAYGGLNDVDNSGIMGLLYPITFLFIVLLSVFSQRIKLKFNTSLILLFIYIGLFYYITNSLVGPPRTSISLVIAFVYSALVIPSITTIDVKTFLRTLIVLPSFAVFRLGSVFAPLNDWNDAISMSVCYSYLIPIVGTIVYMFFYFRDDSRKNKVWILLFCVVNGLFLGQLFLHGSRGALLSIVLLVIFLMAVKKRPNAEGVAFSKGTLGFLLPFLLVFLSSYLFFFQTIINVLSLTGVESHALLKILDLSAEGDISNGRSELNMITFNGIIEHPLFGNGFDRYDANTGLLYPHNFVFQLLYDGGLLFFLAVLIPVCIGLRRLFKKCNYDEFAMTTCLLFCSVPGALFSGNLYASSLLWMFFGFTMSKSFIYSTTCQKN